MSPPNDALGDRMKRQYEDRWRFYLPRRTYTILRVDGRAFHTYTAGLQRPFDEAFMASMDAAACVLANAVDGAQFGYLQSDECSLLVTDFTTKLTDAWFDGAVQKMVSIAAATMTAAFGRTTVGASHFRGPPLFDARVFVIPDPVEVENYFIWRQKDWERNSVQMVARSHYSQKELHGKSCAEMHDMIHAKGDNWATHYTPAMKNGRWLRYEQEWDTAPAPIWSQNREALSALIPQPGYEVCVP